MDSAGRKQMETGTRGSEDLTSYGLVWDGRVIDFRPMEEGKPPLVWTPADRRWTVFDGVMGILREARPITPTDAWKLTSGSPGERGAIGVETR